MPRHHRFMVLKTPASVYITFPVAEMNKTYFPFTYTFFMLINYTNHAVNLILYILTSATFRRDFRQVFCLMVGRHTQSFRAAATQAVTTNNARTNFRTTSLPAAAAAATSKSPRLMSGGVDLIQLNGVTQSPRDEIEPDDESNV